MKKNTKPTHYDKKVALPFALTPAEVKAVHGGKGEVIQKPLP